MLAGSQKAFDTRYRFTLPGWLAVALLSLVALPPATVYAGRIAEWERPALLPDSPRLAVTDSAAASLAGGLVPDPRFSFPGSGGSQAGFRRKPMPYFGFGWSHRFGRGRHLLFNNDAGMMFDSRPGVTGNYSAPPLPAPDIDQQRIEAAAASGHLKWQPVLTVSLSYLF